MKKFKIVLFVILGLVIVSFLTAGTVEFFYLPHYLNNKEEISVDTSTQGEAEIKVMSCNLRCMNPGDLFKKSWFRRADLIMKNITEEKPAIIGFQEATSVQYKYLTDTLPEYDSVIKYRDDSVIKEATPVFYKKDLFELKDKGSFWLSETPDVMSKDWGAACYRICSYVVLTEKQSMKDFVVFNTHLDHISDEARIKGIGVVKDKISQFGGLPSVIMGDFNASESSETYKIITEDFNDVKYLTENPVKSCTYQGWGEDLDSDCIDYIMISKSGFSVNSYNVINTTYKDIYPSDHFQLTASLSLK